MIHVDGQGAKTTVAILGRDCRKKAEIRGMRGEAKGSLSVGEFETWVWWVQDRRLICFKSGVCMMGLSTGLRPISCPALLLKSSNIHPKSYYVI